MVGFIWAWLGSTRHSIERGGYNKHLGKIPVLNVFFFMKVSNKPLWWFILMLVPVLNLFVFSLVLLDNLSKIGEYSQEEKIQMVFLYPIKSRGVL